MPGDKVVLKIVSPTIIHKTEVGGVRVVEKHPDNIRSAWRRMMVEVPENYTALIERRSIHAPETYRGLCGEALQQAIARDIQGVLMVQFMPPDSQAFGNEMIVGIRNTREFGMVISAGLGGTDTELYAERFRKGQAIVAASTAMTDGGCVFCTVPTNHLLSETGRTDPRPAPHRDRRAVDRMPRLLYRHGQLLLAGQPGCAVRHRGAGDQSLCLHRFPDGAPGRHVPLFPAGSPAGRPALSQNRHPAAARNHRHRWASPPPASISGGSSSTISWPMGSIRQTSASSGRALADFEGIRCVPDLASLDVKLDLFVVAVGARIKCRSWWTGSLPPSGRDRSC